MASGARKMFAHHPGTETWNAWLAHHAGTKMYNRMLSCMVDQRPFHTWTKLPPGAPKTETLRIIEMGSGVPTAATPGPKPEPRSRSAEEIEEATQQIAERLAERNQRNAQEQSADRGRRSKTKKADAQLHDALDAVRAGKVPQIDTGENLGTISAIDPFEQDAVVERRKREPEYRGEKVKVVALRDDPVGRMHRRKHLRRDNESDDIAADLRLRAARHWQMLYEKSEIGGARGIDMTKDVVDGGRFVLPDTDGRLNAQDDLADLNSVLGLEGAHLVRRVLGEKFEIKQVAAMMGETSDRAIRYIGRRLVECLDTLAKHLGYVSMKPANGPPRPRDARDDLALYANSPRLYDAVRQAKGDLG